MERGGRTDVLRDYLRAMDDLVADARRLAASCGRPLAGRSDEEVLRGLAALRARVSGSGRRPCR